VADVNISRVCSSLDLRGFRCRRADRACEFVPAKAYRTCHESTFVASLTIEGRALQVLVDGTDRPKTGHVPVRGCRETTLCWGVGIDLGTRAILQVEREEENEVRIAGVSRGRAVVWRNHPGLRSTSDTGVCAADWGLESSQL
jgi:hypothetical protein